MVLVFFYKKISLKDCVWFVFGCCVKEVLFFEVFGVFGGS